jgi:hypothetical protein
MATGYIRSPMLDIIQKNLTDQQNEYIQALSSQHLAKCMYIVRVLVSSIMLISADRMIYF